MKATTVETSRLSGPSLDWVVAISAMEALKPCPFCGGEAEFERLGSSKQSCIVVCADCGARHESSDEYEQCGWSWNQRQTAAPEPLQNRPDSCRNELQAQGKPYPKSGCAVCGNGGMAGCPYEARQPSTHLARLKARQAAAELAPGDVATTGGTIFSQDDPDDWEVEAKSVLAETPEASFSQLKAERDALVAHLERLREALNPFASGGAAACISRGDYSVMRERIKDWMGVKDFERADEALRETPETSLARQKARWQRDLVTQLAEGFRQAWPEHPGKHAWILGAGDAICRQSEGGEA